MIRLLLISLSFYCHLAFSQERDFKYSVCEKISADLDFDGKIDEVRLYKIDDWTDPGDYQKIEFELSSNQSMTVTDYESSYIQLSSTDFGRKNKESNLIESNYIYFAQTSEAYFLLMFGYAYASSPGIITIYRFDQNGVQKVFSDKFDLNQIHLEESHIYLIGLQFYSEVFGSGWEKYTYAPFTVYKINKEKSIDYQKTEQFNIENYVGYLGLSYGNPHALIKDSNGNLVLEFTTYREYPIATLKRLSDDDLEAYSRKELRIMRNEIFADYGYIFKSPDLREYFNGKNWYKARFTDVSEKLTEIEKANVDLILKKEKSKN